MRTTSHIDAEAADDYANATMALREHAQPSDVIMRDRLRLAIVG
jgi:hypothetical protein